MLWQYFTDWRHLMKQRSAIDGYSLPELMIVLVIAAILGGGALTGWQRWQQYQRLTESVQQIQSFLHRVRSYAWRYNADLPLWFKDGERACLGAGEAPERECLAGRRLQLLLTPEGGKITQLIGAPGFYGLSNVAKPGSIIITLKNLSWRILISSRGRIRLCKPEQKACL